MLKFYHGKTLNKCKKRLDSIKILLKIINCGNAVKFIYTAS
jgi:hypothetical protein